MLRYKTMPEYDTNSNNSNGNVDEDEAKFKTPWVLDVLDVEGCDLIREIPQQTEAVIRDSGSIVPLGMSDEITTEKLGHGVVNNIISENRHKLKEGYQLLLHETGYPQAHGIMDEGFADGTERKKDKGTPRYKATYFYMFSDHAIGSLTIPGGSALVCAMAPIEKITVAKTACADPLFMDIVDSEWYNRKCKWSWKEFVDCMEMGVKGHNGVSIDDLLPYKM